MRILHTMLRVVNLERSIDFYTEVLGMRLLIEGAVIELTHNWDVNEYVPGDAFGHIALEVEDVYRACDDIRGRGGNVVRDAGPMKGGTSVIAFVEDPDGYKIELIQKKNR